MRPVSTLNVNPSEKPHLIRRNKFKPRIIRRKIVRIDLHTPGFARNLTRWPSFDVLSLLPFKPRWVSVDFPTPPIRPGAKRPNRYPGNLYQPHRMRCYDLKEPVEIRMGYILVIGSDACNRCEVPASNRNSEVTCQYGRGGTFSCPVFRKADRNPHCRQAISPYISGL